MIHTNLLFRANGRKQRIRENKRTTPPPCYVGSKNDREVKGIAVDYFYLKDIYKHCENEVCSRQIRLMIEYQ